MDPIMVREARPDDLEGFLKLYTEFYNELRLRQGLTTYGPDELREDAEKILARDKLFLAEGDENTAVGFIRISRREGCHWFEELYVKPEHRGRGIGRELVRVAERYVAERDPFAYIMVLPQDRKATKFWLHMGYKLLNTIELAKNLRPSGEQADTRPIPMLSDLVEIYKWAKEDYTTLERRFLELVEEFRKRGRTGEELLKIFVDALETHLYK